MEFYMPEITPVKYEAATNLHTPTTPGDTLPASLIPISTDANNSITIGTDNNLYVKKQELLIVVARMETSEVLQYNVPKILTGFTKTELDTIPGSLVNSIFTVPVAGVWEFNIRAYATGVNTSLSNSWAYVRLFINGVAANYTDYVFTSVRSDAFFQLRGGSWPILLAVGDKVQVEVNQMIDSAGVTIQPAAGTILICKLLQ